MIKAEDLYKSQSVFNYFLAHLLFGICLAATLSVFLVLSREESSIPAAIAASFVFSLSYAVTTKRKVMKRVNLRAIAVIAMTNLAVLFAFLALFW